ncbi:MAG: HNH/ENDO VII family nuclease [Alphaproteobacteria bacterium]|nr:HNH/ENDO VII family nuclease [Alphaproteobacteria bacterium]
MNTQKILSILSIIFLSILFTENNAYSFSLKLQNLNYSLNPPLPQFQKVVNTEKGVLTEKKQNKTIIKRKFDEFDQKNINHQYKGKENNDNKQILTESQLKKKQKFEGIHDFSDEMESEILNLNLDPNKIYLYNETIKNNYRTKEKKVDLSEKLILIDFDKNRLNRFLNHFLVLYKKKKILNDECLKEKSIFLSALHKITSNRKKIKTLEEILKNNSYELIDLINTDYCEHPSISEETEEEKAERRTQRAEQNRLLAEQAALSAPTTKPLEQEKILWKGFFTYFKDRKNEIDEGSGEKITRSEIEDEFETLVSTHYKKIKSDGNIFYYNPDFIPNTIKDSEDRTNLERINNGIAPIGFDGESMNIHHITRHQPGIYVLISETMHQQKSLHLHFRDKKYYPQPKAIDRNEFNHIKQDLFSKLYKELTKSTIQPAQE